MLLHVLVVRKATLLQIYPRRDLGLYAYAALVLDVAWMDALVLDVA